MNHIIDIVFSGFWPFVGFWILASIPFHFVFKCWNRYMRSRNIAARGWPPPHCDADGDAVEPDKEDKS